MAANGTPRPRIDPRILRSWSSGDSEEELTEDSDETSLPWEDLGLGEIFGGRYIDADGTVVVCTTEPIATQSQHGMRVRLVDRSMADLHELKSRLWVDAVVNTSLRDSGLSSAGLDIANNRVVVGVRTQSDADRLLGRKLFRESVDAGALKLHVLGDLVLL